MHYYGANLFNFRTQRKIRGNQHGFVQMELLRRKFGPEQSEMFVLAIGLAVRSCK
jgi:hypothetical protein